MGEGRAQSKEKGREEERDQCSGGKEEEERNDGRREGGREEGKEGRTDPLHCRHGDYSTWIGGRRINGVRGGAGE